MSPTQNTHLIAVLDEDPAICSHTEQLVRSHRMQARSFTSGGEFLALLHDDTSFKPDCVILEVQIGDVSGLEVQLQLSWIRVRTPVIFVTSSCERWIREEALAAGAVRFFNKPLDAARLIAAVHSAIISRLDC
jgi:FixJ family two-component response regulator